MWKFYRVMGTIAAVCLGLGIVALIVFSGFGGWDMVRNRGWHWDWDWGFNQNSSYETEDLEKNFEGDIKSLDISISYGKVNLVEGDNFSFKAERAIKNSFEKLEVSGDTLIIEQKGRRNARLFGWRLEKDYPEITITVPKGFSAEDFSYSIGAGKSDLSGIYAKNISLEMGAGDIFAENLQADKIKISAGAGRLEIADGKLNDMSLDCGVGEIIIGGTITGKNKINAGVGSLKINIDGNIDDYDFDIDKGIGKITVNGEEYERKHIEGAKNSFDIDGGVGEINIQINQNKGKEGLA